MGTILEKWAILLLFWHIIFSICNLSSLIANIWETATPPHPPQFSIYTKHTHCIITGHCQSYLLEELLFCLLKSANDPFASTAWTWLAPKSCNKSEPPPIKSLPFWKRKCTFPSLFPFSCQNEMQIMICFTKIIKQLNSVCLTCQCTATITSYLCWFVKMLPDSLS